jgi:DNA-binding transcriptional LysR family regulator
MDILLLKTFLEVARFRHFGRAAERLHITQSAVSARIKLLEERFGEALFVRKRNAIALTDAGELLLPHADSIVRSWERVWHDVRVGRQYEQTVRLATTIDLWRHSMLEPVAQLLQQVSGLALRVEIGESDRLLEQLADGQYDYALLLEAPRRQELLYHQVASLELQLVATRAAVHVTDLLAGTVNDLEFWNVDWGLLDASDDSGPLVMPRVAISSGEAALQYLLAEGGAAWLPTAWVAPYIKKKQLHAVVGAHARWRNVYLVWRAEQGDVLKLQQCFAASTV